MKKTPKLKYYQLISGQHNLYYSVMIIGGEICQLKTMKRRQYALVYTLAEAKVYKAWLQKKHFIFSIIIPK